MPATLHVELTEQTPTALQLRFWWDNPITAQVRTLALSEIADLVGAAETDYYSPLPGKLAELGRRLYRWLDGDERWLTTAIGAAANGEPVLVLAIAIPHGLAHLPWEVLHDGTRFLLHAANPPVVPARWLPPARGAVTAHDRPPENRPLQTLFMASSPEDVRPVLDYEGEEAAVIEATARHPLDLTVEESGSLKELGALVQDYGPGYFDVLHLTGHADHGKDDQPVFVLEDSEGRRADATAAAIAAAVRDRPPLVFLSGCRTGQNPAHGEVRSLAEQLIAAGFRAVLGWGRPVLDSEATLAAQHLYEHLAAGDTLPLALVRTHVALRDANARGWHLLRVFCAGDAPAPFVTPVRTPGRKRTAARPAESEFLDPLTKLVKVATRAGFVGRRRLLQRALRVLRDPAPLPVGLLLQGQGGRGKSSIAARLCERLRRDFQRVVVIGALDEVSLVNAWAASLPAVVNRLDPKVVPEDKRQDIAQSLESGMRKVDVPLPLRVEMLLNRLGELGAQAPLFVLDDFEQNQPARADGDLKLAPTAATVLLALLAALEHTGIGRVLITCRYALPAPFAGFLHAADVPPLDDTEQKKQALRLDQRAPRRTKDADLTERARVAADGNPRLIEWLHPVLEKPGLDHAGILADLQKTEERFRVDILARHLIASLSDDERALLGQLLMLDLSVPLAAVQALDPARPESALRAALDHAAGLSLVDVTAEDGQPHYRVPHQLGGDPPLLPVPDGAGRPALAGRVFDVLYALWRTAADGTSEGRMLELIRLAKEGGRRERLAELARLVTSNWLNAHRYAETAALLEPLLEAGRRHCMLLVNLARAQQTLGHGQASGVLLEEAVAGADGLPDADRAPALFHYTNWLGQQGDQDELLRISRDELLPLLKRTGANREYAMVMGQIADVLAARGEVDEALRIYREEELPAYERLGDVRERSVTMGKIADVLAARGEVDEALRIRREEELPVYERLGDVRERAVTMGKIADVLAARGEVDEAMRIRREEQLPVYERLGDVRERAVTMGKIADVLAARGEVDEAMRIRREEQLPVYERLGDVRARAVTMGKIADVLAARGEVDEALRIRREEELPVYERLGDVRERAVTMGKIADVLAARGEVDEAMRIRREEQLPVYERLGDVRARAVTMGKIADVLAARGEVDEALRTYLEEVLPAFDRLGDVQSQIVGRAHLAMLLLKRGREEDMVEAVQHLIWGYGQAVQRGYALAGQIAGILQQLGLNIPGQS